jgi:hypothetical protein
MGHWKRKEIEKWPHLDDGIDLVRAIEDTISKLETLRKEY